jgi:tryptophan synthase alpha subunit
MYNKYDKIIEDAIYELSTAKDSEDKSKALDKIKKAENDVKVVLLKFYNTLHDLGLEEGFNIIIDRLGRR